MKNRGQQTEEPIKELLYQLSTKSSLLKMSEERHNDIIKMMYADVDIDKHVKSLDYLTEGEQSKLSAILHKYQDMFKGVIGTLKIPPVQFELKPDARPYHAKPFPVPKRTSI